MKLQNSNNTEILNITVWKQTAIVLSMIFIWKTSHPCYQTTFSKLTRFNLHKNYFLKNLQSQEKDKNKREKVWMIQKKSKIQIK